MYAGAYPFKITTDEENPELYAIKSGRGDAYWWTLDATDGTIVLSSYVYAETQFWYFMEVTEGGQTYLQLYPYAGKGKVMSYQDHAAGAAKVWAKNPGEAGYDTRWIFDNNGGNAPYGLKTADGSIWLSNYGGSGYKFGFWTNGPAGDAGTAMYFEPVSELKKKFSSVYTKAAEILDLYHLQEKYGLVKSADKFSSNAVEPKEGSLANLIDNNYSTFFHSAWSVAVDEKHYLQAEVSKPVKDFVFYFKKRHNNNNNRPTDLTIFGSNDGETFTEITNINSGFPTDGNTIDYMSDVISASESYKYFRFVINATNNNGLNNGYAFFTFSEFYMFPSDKLAYVQETLPELQEVANFIFDLEEDNVFAEAFMNTFSKYINAYLAGRDVTEAKAGYDEVVALSKSNDLFTPVLDATSLAANKQYMIVAEKNDGVVAMAAPRVGGATPYRLSTDVRSVGAVVVNTVATAEGEALPYMVALEAVEGGWLLKDVVYNKYLLWEEKRSLDLTADMTKASVFEISINEEGEAEIKLAGENRTIRYSAEDERFACYTIGQEAVKLYEDAIANDFFLAYAEMGELFNTCQSLFMIPAVSEKAMAVAEAVEALNAVGVVSCANDDLVAATVAMSELVTYAWAMDAKYAEFKDALWACYDLQDNSTASVKVAAVFAAVVDKYKAMQWGVPAATVADFDAYIAELNDAARAYALKAVPVGDFTFDNIAVESEWAGTALEKSLAAYLYNPAAKAFLGSANSWGTQASFLENGYKWTVSTEAICDFEWLFDGAEDICAANVGGINLAPRKWVGNKQTPVPFEEGEDNGIISTEEGIYLPKTTSLFLDLNEEADLRNYTLVYDIKLADVKSYTSLLQTDIENDDNDGELFVYNGKLGINRGTPGKYLGYNGNFTADTWHKVVVVGNEGSIATYLDGLFIGATGPDKTWPEAWVINKEGVYFFLDEGLESTDVEVAGIQLWKKCLSDVEIAQMSGVTEIEGEPVPNRTAQWSFDNAENLFANEAGDITLAPRKTGDNNTAPTEFAEGEDNGVVKTEEGIAISKSTCLFMALNEQADLKNYTLVYDFKAADVTSNYISFLQTNLLNNEDGDLFMNKSSQFGINQANLGYKGKLNADTWYRLAAVVRDGFMNLFINGEHVGSSAAAHNIWTINKEGVFFFLDNDGEHNSLELGGLQFWNQALSNAHIAAMGGAFAEDADVKVEVPAAAAPTHTMSGPLCHPSNVNQHYLNNGYGDGLAEAHTFTLVAKNTYAIQNSKGLYYAYKDGTTVVQMVNEMDENCYWQFVTAEEFRSKYAQATYDAPANATFEIPGQNFGYNNTEVKEWTGSPSFGGEWANFVAYKKKTENCEMSTVLRDMPNGVYRLKVQGFYRQGDANAAAEARKNGTEIHPAKFFANDATVTVMSIIDEAGKNTTSTHGGMYGDYGKCPWSNNDASVYFNLGLYEHELVFTLPEGVDTIKIGLSKNGGVANDWIVMDNYRLEYLGTYKEVSYFGEIEQLSEGEKYVYYTDAAGKKHYLYAAGAADWVVVDDPVTIKFSQGNVDGGFADAASFMESNGFYMSNAQNGDGTGRINTQDVNGELGQQKRVSESQVFYKNAAGKYAIRMTNANATNWGAFCFVNINPETLEVMSGQPTLGDELYLWTVEDKVDTAIDEVVDAEVANRAYYTLGGVPVDAPVKGVNIVKTTYTNGKVEIQKVLVK